MLEYTNPFSAEVYRYPLHECERIYRESLDISLGGNVPASTEFTRIAAPREHLGVDTRVPARLVVFHEHLGRSSIARKDEHIVRLRITGDMAAHNELFERMKRVEVCTLVRGDEFFPVFLLKHIPPHVLLILRLCDEYPRRAAGRTISYRTRF